MTFSIIDVLIILLINYLALVPVFYYILKTKLDLIRCMTLARTPKSRIEIGNLKSEALSNKSYSFAWPIFLIRSKNESSKKRR